ncbi:MAG: pirin family protein [Candidatus Krumholzibacteria bacterium]|nr:pirin family protein [Candidatus Krumholzibacteria bacterium]
MSVSVVPLQKQARGQFNGGAILENKPIGFPQDGGELRPYSSLFYWAHAWTPGAKSLIGEHPHQGFEIMTFVLKGSIEHYDSKNRDWRKLEEGDAQIIRAGSGISHAEMINEASEMFQIWIDPDLGKTLRQPPSYDDYKSASFPVRREHGQSIKTYHGQGSPLTMTTPGITIKDTRFDAGEHKMALDVQQVYSAYLLDGGVTVDGNAVEPKGFTIIKQQESVTVSSSRSFRIFVIESPAKLDYQTYAGRHQ